jgi:hypothetical protein
VTSHDDPCIFIAAYLSGLWESMSLTNSVLECRTEPNKFFSSDSRMLLTKNPNPSFILDF